MQENTQGFDRGISIWGRHIHHCSSMDGVSFWNGAEQLSECLYDDKCGCGQESRWRVSAH
jgi:hypothetical protein